MKYKIIKMLDLAGLNVFEPIVRLATMEDPKTQLRKIFQFIIIPVFAFFFFLVMWNYIAPRHTTKSGEVPTPPVVAEAWDGILTFHERENQKMKDFSLKGDARQKEFVKVEERMKALVPLIESSEKELKAMLDKQKEIIAMRSASIEKEFADKKLEIKNLQKSRSNELKEKAVSIQAGDDEAKKELLALVRKDRKLKNEEKEVLNALKEEINKAVSFVYAPAKEARKQNSALMAERQYLMKRKDLLSDDNRTVKVDKAEEDLNSKHTAFMAASGKSLLTKAKSLVRKEESISRIKNSNYAKPWTFLDQITRSIACVFVGFAIAIIIAIPVGILCGLSNIFMAAMMPLISLFKPVSPIVWLPIVFIIVGGFIDDPENAAVHPAFLSSAITVALCSLWPTLVNTALGVASIEKDYLNVAKVLKLGFWSRLFKIVIPSALPLIFTGLRISLGVGWMVLVAAELLSSSEGIGKFVWDMFNNGSSETFAQMFVVVFIVGIVGLLLDRIMIVLQRSVSFGQAASTL